MIFALFTIHEYIFLSVSRVYGLIKLIPFKLINHSDGEFLTYLNCLFVYIACWKSSFGAKYAIYIILVL